MWVQILVHPTHGIEYYSVWGRPSPFITNPWLRPASQTQFRPQLFSLPVSQPLPLTWILGPHSMAVSSLGGFWLRITWAFNYSWWIIFTGMIDDSSSQADFIPLLGLPPYFLHLPLLQHPSPNLVGLRISGEIPFSEVGFFKNQLSLYSIWVSLENIPALTLQHFVSVWLIRNNRAWNVLYIKFQIREWKHFKKNKKDWIMWALWKLFSGAI